MTARTRRIKNPPLKNRKLLTRTPGEPFKRIDASKIEIDPRLTSNRFLDKPGAVGSWGEKAHRDLIVTQGKSFRHEKTKKKRGSYMGGLIDQGVHSVKFDSD